MLGGARRGRPGAVTAQQLLSRRAAPGPEGDETRRATFGICMLARRDADDRQSRTGNKNNARASARPVAAIVLNASDLARDSETAREVLRDRFDGDLYSSRRGRAVRRRRGCR